MKIPEIIRKRLESWATKKIRTKPNLVIGETDNPYLKRWYVIPRNRFFNIYLHYFMRSDDDRALHCHPWFNSSILLSGSYREHTKRGVFLRKQGHVYFRDPWRPHRVELLHMIVEDDGFRIIINGPDKTWAAKYVPPYPVITLFITGPKIREWGFHCPQGWRHWKDFVSVRDGENGVGKGCD